MKRMIYRLAFLLAVAVLAFQQGCAPEDLLPTPKSATAPVNEYGLPPEAVETLALIRQGGPFRYRQDGTVFQNREGLLPQRPRGYYREYTVPTPGAQDRGARRFVTGGDPPEVFYYTEDHYRSFRRIEPKP